MIEIEISDSITARFHPWGDTVEIVQGGDRIELDKGDVVSLIEALQSIRQQQAPAKLV